MHFPRQLVQKKNCWVDHAFTYVHYIVSLLYSWFGAPQLISLRRFKWYPWENLEPKQQLKFWLMTDYQNDGFVNELYLGDS